MEKVLGLALGHFYDSKNISYRPSGLTDFNYLMGLNLAHSTNISFYMNFGLKIRFMSIQNGSSMVSRCDYFYKLFIRKC